MARRAWPAILLLVTILAGCTSVGVDNQKLRHRQDLRRQIDLGANDYVALGLPPVSYPVPVSYPLTVT